MHLETCGSQAAVVPSAMSHLMLLLQQGDPSALPYAVDATKSLLGKKPIFGICMGHQILGQAIGAAPSSSNSATTAATTPSDTTPQVRPCNQGRLLPETSLEC